VRLQRYPGAILCRLAESAIVNTISDVNPGASQRAQDEMESKVAKLPEQPELDRLSHVAGAREMVVRPANTVTNHTVTGRLTVSQLRYIVLLGQV
jgi:hypothetical protein